MLSNVDDYTGFQFEDYVVNYKKLFSLF
jgi:hypothetical protein